MLATIKQGGCIVFDAAAEVTLIAARAVVFVAIVVTIIKVSGVVVIPGAIVGGIFSSHFGDTIGTVVGCATSTIAFVSVILDDDD